VTSSTDLRFLGDAGLALSLALALVLAGLAWWLYRRELAFTSPLMRQMLPALRAAAVFFVVLMLAGPVLHHRRVIGELARVLVFVDASRSMDVTDEFMELPRKVAAAKMHGWLPENAVASNEVSAAVVRSNEVLRAAVARFDSLTRWQRLDTLLTEAPGGILPALASAHETELWALWEAEARPLWNAAERTPLPAALAAKPGGNSTDLGGALKASINALAAERGAVVLFSDGRHNAGISPIEVARLAQARGIPVHTVGLGGVERPPDLAVISANGPESVFFEDRVKGDIDVKDDMPAGTPFTIRIEESGQLLWEKSLVTEGSHRRRIQFDFPIKDLVEKKKAASGEIELTSLPFAFNVSIPGVEGEKDAANNARTLHLRGLTQRRKLLLLDGRPRWEFRYVRNMFERNPLWEVNALTANVEAKDEWTRGGRPGEFPSEREQLLAYDLILFGEVPEGMLTKTEQEWIRDFVGVRGGGLIFMDGRRNLLPLYARGELAPLLPVERLQDASDAKPARIQLTDIGAAHDATRLRADAEGNASAWSERPPPHWIAAVRALPGAETLAEAVAGDRRLPAVVHRRFGAGQVLYLATDEFWRWRFRVADQFHEPLWHQFASAVMETPYTARDKHVELDAGAASQPAGQPAAIRARLRDEQGRIIVEGQATAVLYRGERKLAHLPLEQDEGASGAFRGMTPPLAAGDYEVRIEAPGLLSEPSAVRVALHVADAGAASGERVDLNCNEDLLVQMAKASGGEYFREEDARKVVEKLAPLSKGHIEESDTVLWQSWWWFVPVVGFLTVEWMLRKRAGLV
jgi:hypothetical protein